MRAAAPRISLQRRAVPYPFPSPVGGWNNRDAIAAMRPGDAVELVNFFPRQSFASFRRGYTSLADLGTGESVSQLIPYHVGATKQLLASSGTQLFRVTIPAYEVSTGYAAETLADGEASALAIDFTDDSVSATGHYGSAYIRTPGVELKSDLTSAYISYAQFGGRLIMCNGEDTPFSYDGTSIIAHGWTDASGTLDFADLNFVTTFKRRVYFIEKDTQSFWYGGVGNVQGALEKFDLGLVGTFRGSLKVLTAITGDGGDGGPDDLFIAIFSEGDIVVYQGSDPGDSTNWNKIGEYKIGEPLSRFGHTTNGADVQIITSRGYESLVRSSREGEGVRARTLVSDKIQKEVSQIIRASGASDDWRLNLYNRGQMMIFQAPLATSMRHHVRNIDTGAWCRFSLKKLRSFAILDQVCYCGDESGVVHTFDSGDTDNGETIVFTAQLAWSPLRDAGTKKIIQHIFLNMTASWFPAMQVSIAADYAKHIRYTNIAIPGQENAVAWGEAYWDDPNYWSQAQTTREIYHKHGAEGRSFSLRLSCFGRRGDLDWNGVIFYATQGGQV